MQEAMANLLHDSWVYLRSFLGLTAPYIIIFMVGIPLLSFLVNVYLRWHRKEDGAKTMGQTIKDSFLSKGTLIPLGVCMLAWLALFGWSIINTIYVKNENKNETITSLTDEIKNLKNKPKKEKTINGTLSPQKPTSNLAYVRIASQKQLYSTNPELPYALEVIIQTDKAIKPVAFLIEFDGPIGKGNAEMSGVISAQITQGVRGEKRTNFYFQWLSPSLTQDKTIIVDVLSKTYVRAIALKKVKYVEQ